MKYKLIQWYEALCLILLCLIPFNAILKFSDFYFPYVTSKGFYFRILVESLFCFYLIFRIFTNNLQFQFSKISVFFAGFTLSTFICDYFGENFYQSFWSSSARMDGFVSQLHLLVYFLLLPLILNTKQKWIRFIYIQAIVSAIISIISILQVFDLYQVVSNLRPDSMFGNPSYLSVYSLINIFISLYLLNEAGGARKLFLNALVCLNVISIYLSKTRASYLALAVALFFLLITYLQNEKNKQARIKFLTQILSLSIVSIVSIIVLNLVLSLKNNKTQILAERLTESDSIYSRYYFWKASLNSFLENPLLGIGQDNFIYLSKFYDPKMFSEPWFDRSHNFIVDLIVNFGILGTMSYFIFIAGIFILLIKNKYLKLIEKCIIASAILGYLINNMFLFEFLSGQIVFLSLVAFIGFYEGCFAIPKPVQDFKIDLKRTFSCFLILIFGIGLVFQVNIHNILANLELKRILEKKEFFKVVEGKKEVVFQSLLKSNLFIKEDAFQNLIQAASLIKDSVNENDVYSFVDSEINENLIKDSKNIYNKYMAASFYAKYKNYSAAEKLYTDALSISPNNQEILISFGTMYLSKADYEKANEKFQLAFDLENTNPKARLYLIASSNFKNDFQKSISLLEGFLDKQLVYKFDSKIIESFIFSKRNDLAVSVIEKKCDSGFDCSRDYLLLGRAYYYEKQFSQAEVYFNKAIGFNPNIRDEVLRTIKQ